MPPQQPQFLTSIIDIIKENMFVMIIVFCVILFIIIYNKIFPIIMEHFRKTKKILIVDDKTFPYFDEIKRKYYVEKVKDIDTRKMDDILKGTYAVILLDIKGIGNKLEFTNEGFGILKFIKDKRPGQCIIAFSDEMWSLKHQKDFACADKVFSKTEGIMSFKDEIDDLLLKSSLTPFTQIIIQVRRVTKLWKKIS